LRLSKRDCFIRNSVSFKLSWASKATTYMRNIFILLAIILTLPSSIQAQQQEHESWCGTEISAEWMEAFYQRDKSHLTNKIGTYPAVNIPIIYHIVGDDNGNGYFELPDVFRAHCELQDLYNEADVFFYIKSIDYIDDSNWYSGNNTTSLFSNFNDRDVCNVYIVSQMSGVCGYSYVPEAWNGSGWSGPNRGGIMLAQNCMQASNTTYRHEMGHYLNLPHTFFGWEGENPPGVGANAPNTINGSPVERADQSNCYSSGDGFCDTPPDYLSDRWTCNFARNYRDPLGNLFTTDESNFMSYSADGCSNYLKDEQLAEVNAASANHRPYLLNNPVPTFQAIPQITGLAPAQNTFNLNPTSIKISWNSAPNAVYYHLQATRFNFSNPTIDVVIQDTAYIINNPAIGETYQWRVKAINFTDVCQAFTAERTFSTSSLSAEINVTNSSCIQNSDGEIEILMDQTGSFDYYWSCNDPFINSAIQNVNSYKITNLSPETYAVTVVSSAGDTLYTQTSVLSPNALAIDINQVGEELIATISGGTPPYSYIWDNGSESLSLSDIASGDYSLIVVDQFGCQKTEVGTFSETATGIKDLNTDLIGNILIAPNPSQTGIIQVVVPMKEQGDIQISVVDLSGKVLNYQSLNAIEGLNTFEMNLSDLSKGIYIVHAQSALANRSAKLVIR
jgi:hypothetical protein